MGDINNKTEMFTPENFSKTKIKTASIFKLLIFEFVFINKKIF